MTQRPQHFTIYLAFLLQFVYFNICNNSILVLSCKTNVRAGKSLKIFETYKKRPGSDSSNKNRLVKTLLFPKNYPTAGINNAYLDINSESLADILINEETEAEENTTVLIQNKYMPTEEPIIGAVTLRGQEKNEKNAKTLNIESKKEEDTIGNKKEGSRNGNDFQEKYIDSLRRRGELGSTPKNIEELSAKRKENGLLEEEKEGSGMHTSQLRNEQKERDVIVHRRNSDDLEYGRKNYKDISFKNRLHQSF